MNKLLPLLMAVVLVALGAVVYIATRDKPQPRAYVAPAEQDHKPTVGGLTPRATGRPGDRDDPLETIKTLTGLQERMNRQLEEERKEKRRLEKEIRETQKTAKQQQEQLEKRLLGAINELKETARDAAQKATTAAKSGAAMLDRNMPDGLGFDNLPIGGGNQGAGSLLKQPQTSYVSVTPMGGGATSPDGGLIGGVLPKMFGPNRSSSKDAANTTKTLEQIQAERAAEEPKPRYTINDAATLYTNSSMTALLGKVPVGGKLTDPYRFKLITGGDNLAASGLRLPPGIKNIVWTGYTVGNRELSCVSGYLDTVSLVFEDGTISTTTIKRKNQRRANTRQYLGYIADRWGKPCITGELFSNASDYMKDRIALAALSAAGEGVALGETSTVRNRNGDYETILNGDTGKFILGRTVSGGMKEAIEYIRERMRDAYDVVYVGTGRHFTVHVEDQIEFDHDPKGRKLDHGSEKKTALASFD